MVRVMSSRRPDMREYFKARIDWHVRGMLARSASYPSGVARVAGDVTDRLIVVTMRDGSVFTWTGGEYSARKVNGCYAPLMPKVADKGAGA